MLTTDNKYPFFDLSEIVADNDIPFKPYQALKPIKAGNYIPDLKFLNDYTRWQSFFNGAQTHGPVALRQFLKKPLVIAFYSRHWGQFGLDQLKHLNNIQQEIKANGGNLLIISDERTDELAKKAWENSYTLNFYHDEEKTIAQTFRVYSDSDPVWNRFSGIDVNVPLLATYIIDDNKQVIYNHIDYDFLETFNGEDIISSVYESSLIANSRKSA
ncbi:peroxiredoxin family protein [Mucilaginibacter dorajii]|uniref:Alkyl hydroperoxide reductase subunit C/ Thiol specific antioxidant domain-containing protein n=1 Tax=Mucilaginibacter dorajii TaxID=692994 RepID=A0ABP7QR73_9SPHI|nr:peroxiredoxin family protein [Mucilaginibacter dorajii]MCS3733984.1 peroxiredoxin [Mucilaginibacter dorajii]